jgi:hypothetical protein
VIRSARDHRSADERLRSVLEAASAKARGDVASEDDRPAPAAEERDRVRRRAMRDHQAFGLPAPTAQLVVEDRLFSTGPLETVKTWIGAPTPVLVLVGDPGVGKSVACAWGALERVGQPGGLGYVLESELAEWHWARRRHEADWQRLLEASTVIVDELGRTETSRRELARVAVAELVHYRASGYGNRRRTLLQGNVALEDLEDVLDPRLVDRLVEIGTVRHFSGASLRGRR